MNFAIVVSMALSRWSGSVFSLVESALGADCVPHVIKRCLLGRDASRDYVGKYFSSRGLGKQAGTYGGLTVTAVMEILHTLDPVKCSLCALSFSHSGMRACTDIIVLLLQTFAHMSKCRRMKHENTSGKHRSRSSSILSLVFIS
jgi:hypothetical protein